MKVRMEEIETITYFNKEKHPQPIRFRIEVEGGQRQVVFIDRICYIKEDKRAGNIVFLYDCQGFFHGLVRPFQLLYDIKTCKWFLYKI